MGGRIDAFGDKAVGLVEHDKERLLSPADRQILRPEQHVVDDPEHRADDGGKHLGRQTRDIEYRYGFVVSDPVPDEGVEVALDPAIQIGLIATAGRKKEREPCVLQAAAHEVELPLEVALSSGSCKAPDYTGLPPDIGQVGGIRVSRLFWSIRVGVGLRCINGKRHPFEFVELVP